MDSQGGQAGSRASVWDLMVQKRGGAGVDVHRAPHPEQTGPWRVDSTRIIRARPPPTI